MLPSVDGAGLNLHYAVIIEIRTVAIGNPERHVRKDSHLGSKQQ